jgi:hypothetical protein
MRTTCKKCHRKPVDGLGCVCRSPIDRRLYFKRFTYKPHLNTLCEPCASREIERRNRIDRMEPGAVAFVLANGGRL